MDQDQSGHLVVLVLAQALVLLSSVLDLEHHLAPAHHSSALALEPLESVQVLEQDSLALGQEVVGPEIRHLLVLSRGLTEIRSLLKRHRTEGISPGMARLATLVAVKSLVQSQMHLAVHTIQTTSSVTPVTNRFLEEISSNTQLTASLTPTARLATPTF